MLRDNIIYYSKIILYTLLVHAQQYSYNILALLPHTLFYLVYVPLCSLNKVLPIKECYLAGEYHKFKPQLGWWLCTGHTPV